MGADGLILYTPEARGATMRLLNADGSPSEVSGNGLRGLGAILAEDLALPVGGTLHVRTGAGMKTLTLVSRDAAAGRLVFRADMGPVEDLGPGSSRRRAARPSTPCGCASATRSA